MEYSVRKKPWCMQSHGVRMSRVHSRTTGGEWRGLERLAGGGQERPPRF